MKVLFLELAEAELDDSVRHYEEQLAGLGDQFLVEVNACLARIVQFPEAYQAVGQYARRCLLSRFPYGVIYQYRPDAQMVLVVAIAHMHRQPEYWIRRDTGREIK